MIRKTMIAGGLTVLFLVLLSCGCSRPNTDPTIISITGPASVQVNNNAQYTCEAIDPDGDSLTYTWSCTQGTLLTNTGKTVTWKAPGRSGTANLEVTVRDGKGGSDSQSRTISVTTATVTVLEWAGAVQAGYYKYWAEILDADYRVYGNFSVDAHDITFLILDAANYENWRRNNSYNHLVRVSRSSGSDFSATVPSSGTYYIILDNTFSIFTDKFARLNVYAQSP